MKRFLSLLCVITMAVSLCACSGSNSGVTPAPTNQGVVPTQASYNNMTPEPGEATRPPEEQGGETNESTKYASEFLLPVSGAEDYYGKVVGFDETMFKTSDGSLIEIDRDDSYVMEAVYKNHAEYEYSHLGIPEGTEIVSAFKSIAADYAHFDRLGEVWGYCDQRGFLHFGECVSEPIDGEILYWLDNNVRNDHVYSVVYRRDGNLFCAEYLTTGVKVTEEVPITLYMRNEDGTQTRINANDIVGVRGIGEFSNPRHDLCVFGNLFFFADGSMAKFVEGTMRNDVEYYSAQSMMSGFSECAFDEMILEPYSLDGYDGSKDTLLHLDLDNSFYIFTKPDDTSKIYYVYGWLDGVFAINLPEGHSTSDIRLSKFHSYKGFGVGLSVIVIFNNGDVYTYECESVQNVSNIIGLDLVKDEQLSSVGQNIVDIVWTQVYKYDKYNTVYRIVMDDNVPYCTVLR